MPGPVITFGAFELDPTRECLLRDGRPVPLTPKAYALLRHFLANPDRLLTKDDLLDALWTDTAVSDASLKVCVAELRKALGDDPASPRYVATLHRRGYRFIAAIGERAASAATPAPGTALPGLVGREAAYARLERALADARRGARQTLFVTGEPGIGKTALVDAFLDRLDPTVLRARGQCLELYGAGEPYLPVLDAFGRLCRDPTHAEVLALVRRTAPSWATALPGVAAGTTAFPTSRSRMLLELVEAVEQITASQPLVLVLEDMHWSDHSTLDLLSLLGRRPDASRLLVIATYRPIDVVVQGHPLGRLKEDLLRRGHAHELALEFLAETEIGLYLQRRLGAEALPAGLAAFVHAHTDGNPLFMVNVVDLLLARGVLAGDGGRWTFAREQAEAERLVPDSLRHMIAHMMTALTADERRLLDAASVAGAEPSSAAVAAALDAPSDAVEDALVELTRRGGLIAARGADVWPDGTRTARFGFIHAMYQSVLYESLPPSRLRALHQRIGERIGAAFAADPGEVAAELALHFEAAGDGARALPHFRQAGERALARHAYREAIDHLERALAMLDGGARDPEAARVELDLRMRLGPALMAVHGFAAPEVERCYARARALCHASGKTPELASALRGLGVFHLTRAELAPARELAEESLALAESGDDPTRFAQAHVAVGIALYYLGELDPAARHLERARRLLGRGRPKRASGTVQAPIVNALAYLATTSWFRGRPDTALRWAEEARATAARLDHPHSILWAAHVTALVHHHRGEPAAAAAAADVAIGLATELEFQQWIAWGTFFRGWLATAEGEATTERHAAGISAMRAGLDEYRQTGAELGTIYFIATLAEAEGRAGRRTEARTLLAEGLALATARGERYYAAELHRLLAGLDEDPVASEAELRRAVRLATRQGGHALALRAATDLARRLIGDGRAADGREILQPIYRRIREGADTADLRTARAVLETVEPATRTRPLKGARRRSSSGG